MGRLYHRCVFCYTFIMDPDEPAPVPDAAVTPAIAPPVDDAATQNDAPAESEQVDAPVSPPNIEITDEPAESPVSPPNIDIANAPVDLAIPPVAEPAVSVAPAVPVVPAAFDPHSTDELNFLRTVLSPRAWASHRARTQARLDRIMALARQKGQIDRADVRDLLNRSKPACTRYLTALVKQGKLTRHRVLDDTVYRVVG
jgi:hypothetical protein